EGAPRRLRTEHLGRPLIVAGRDPDNHPEAPRSRTDGRRSREVDVRLRELRSGVGNSPHPVVTLDQEGPLRLAERNAALLGGPSEHLRILRNEIDLGLAAAEREPEESKQVHSALFQRREDPLSLAGRVWSGRVVVLDASHRVGHHYLLLEPLLHPNLTPL